MKRLFNWQRAVTNKYNHLLTSLCFMFILYPFITTIKIRIPLINLFFIFAILPALYASISTKMFRNFTLMVIVCYIIDIFRVYDIFGNNSFLFLFSIIMYAVLLTIAIYALIRKINTQRIITTDVIKGGISIYLLLGILWMIFYSILNRFDPNAISLECNKSTNFLYLSFTTLTTLGYGDILPLTPIAKILTITEALTGQIFLATLVARLVGLKIAMELKQG